MDVREFAGAQLDILAVVAVLREGNRVLAFINLQVAGIERCLLYTSTVKIAKGQTPLDTIREALAAMNDAAR